MNKVRVNITNPDAYTAAAYRNMNGKEGHIIEQKDSDWFDNHHSKQKALVEFHAPAEKLYTYGRPVQFFWFPMEDLIIL